MLTSYEKQVLDDFEAEFSRPQPWLRELAMGLRLPVAFIVLLEVLLPPGEMLAPIVRTLTVAALGVVIGWLMVSALRRHVMGPRVRRQLRRLR